jgi:D-tyrosyl-tRNA(Tyr) deacylase
VSRASVDIGGKTAGSIERGFLVLLGVREGDTEAEAKKLAGKITELRVFEDGDGKMNLSLRDAGGSLLVVSQFTLYGNCRHGRRPEFLEAARPETALPLYRRFVSLCEEKGFHVETGEFGAEMRVFSVNDGPVTLILDTDTL